MPTVSIIIPTYNRSALLRHALESALTQTHPDCQVVVVDDGSTDDTRAVVASYGPAVTYLHQANAGVCAARNAGAAQARGEFLLFLDSDDVLRREAVSVLLEALLPFPQVGMAYGQAAIMNDAGKRTNIRKPPFDRPAGPWSGPQELEHLVIHNYLATPALVIRRSVWAATRGFDPARGHICEDWDLWARIALIADVAYVPVPVVDVLAHEGSLSTTVDDASLRLYLANHELIINRTLANPRVRASGAINEARAHAANRYHAARLAYVQHDTATARHEMSEAVHLYPRLVLDGEFEDAAMLWMKLRMPEGIVNSLRALKHGGSRATSDTD